MPLFASNYHGKNTGPRIMKQSQSQFVQCPTTCMSDKNWYVIKVSYYNVLITNHTRFYDIKHSFYDWNFDRSLKLLNDPLC